MQMITISTNGIRMTFVIHQNAGDVTVQVLFVMFCQKSGVVFCSENDMIKTLGVGLHNKKYINYDEKSYKDINFRQPHPGLFCVLGLPWTPGGTGAILCDHSVVGMINF